MPPKKNSTAKSPATKSSKKDKVKEEEEEEEEEPKTTKRTTRQSSASKKQDKAKEEETKKSASKSKQRPSSKKKAKDEDEEDEEQEEEKQTLRRSTRGQSKKDTKADSAKKTAPKAASKAASKTAAKAKAAKAEEEDEDEASDEPVKKSTPKSGRKAASASKKGAKSKAAKAEEEEDEDEEPKQKSASKSTSKAGSASKASAKSKASKAKDDEKDEEEEDKSAANPAPAQTTPTTTQPAKKQPAKRKPKKKKDSGYSPYSGRSYYGGYYGGYGYRRYGSYSGSEVNTDQSDEDEGFSDDEPKKGGKRGRTKSQDAGTKKAAKGAAKGRKKTKGDIPPDQLNTLELDSEVMVRNNIRVYGSKDNPFDKYIEEFEASDPDVKKFFHMQVLEDYASAFPNHFYTFYRWGKIGEIGEWVLRGYFNKSRATKIYQEKLEEKEKQANKNGFKDTGKSEQKQTQDDTTQPSQATTQPSQNAEAKPENKDEQQEEHNGDKKENATDMQEETKPKDQEKEESKAKDEKMEVEEKKQEASENTEEKKDKPEADSKIVEEKQPEAVANTEEKKDEPGNDSKMVEEKKPEENQKDGENKEQAKASSKMNLEKLDIQVDKYCPIRAQTEVFIKDDEIFDMKYNVSDIERNSNHFYMFQVLRNTTDKSKHYIFYRYGRVGLMGEWVLRGAFTEEQAIQAYRAKQNEKKDQQKYTALEMSYVKDVPKVIRNMNTMIIRDNKTITEKLEFLESLRQIQIAYQMINNEAGDDKANPIDTNYDKLKCDIEPVDPNSDDYKMISEFIDNTKESYEVEIMEMFKINKHGSKEVFKNSLNNHLMLWHGSRLTNFVGILSQGLRIAPPEAPVSGYRLGKGIYLADMISKSVPYCYASNSDNTFCIMVCETALGNVNEKLHDDFYASNLPADKHSTKALGHVAPPQSSYKEFEKDVYIPSGKPEKTAYQNSSFQHNEYIVYNVNQVQIRYLLKMKQKRRGLFW